MSSRIIYWLGKVTVYTNITYAITSMSHRCELNNLFFSVPVFLFRSSTLFLLVFQFSYEEFSQTCLSAFSVCSITLNLNCFVVYTQSLYYYLYTHSYYGITLYYVCRSFLPLSTNYWQVGCTMHKSDTQYIYWTKLFARKGIKQYCAFSICNK